MGPELDHRLHVGPGAVQRDRGIQGRVPLHQYVTNADFLFGVPRVVVAGCPVPVLVMPDETPAHPYEPAIESAMLAEGRDDLLPVEGHEGEDPARGAARAYVPQGELAGLIRSRTVPARRYAGPRPGCSRARRSPPVLRFACSPGPQRRPGGSGRATTPRREVDVHSVRGKGDVSPYPCAARQRRWWPQRDSNPRLSRAALSPALSVTSGAFSQRENHRTSNVRRRPSMNS